MFFFVVSFAFIVVAQSIVVQAITYCQTDLKDLHLNCKDFVQIRGPQIEPSVQCCNSIKHANESCACSHVTPVTEKRISMEKVVRITRVCGKPLTGGTKCRSKLYHLQYLELFQHRANNIITFKISNYIC